MRQTNRLFLLPSFAAAVVASGLLLSGCATLFSGQSQEVEIDSTPSNAEVMVNGTQRATTPATIEISRPGQGDPPEITLDKEGYEEKTLRLQKKFNAVTLLNILNPFNYALGVPVVGFGVDWYTGSFWKYAPEAYTVELGGGSASSRAPTPYKNRVERAAPTEVERYNLKDLPTGEDGHRVVPAHDHAVSVYDPDTGTIYRFQ
jgi:hypothetical protein